MVPGSSQGFRLPRTVVALGFVSLLTDISSEMIFPLLPVFLAARVPNAPVLLGAMEGVADLVASLFKYLSGRWADRSARLKPLVIFGYGVAAVARPLMAFVTAAWQPVLIRSLDRVGKGLRSSPRDAMISLAVPREARGRAFGFHRGMDHAGAALGTLAAVGLIAAGLSVEHVFLWAAVPGALGVVVIALAREPERPRRAPHADGKPPPPVQVPARLAYFLVPVALFGLANATDAFLLLRLSEQGAHASVLPVAWLLLHVVKSAVSYPAGQLADRLGPHKVVFAGWALYAIAYAAVGFSGSWRTTLALIGLYGLYHAFAEGAEKALLSTLVPPEAQGRAFGLYNAVVGLVAPVSGVTFGLIWNRFGANAAFWMGAAVAALAAAAFLLCLPRARPLAGA